MTIEGPMPLDSILELQPDSYRIGVYLTSVLVLSYIGFILIRLQKAKKALLASNEQLEREVSTRTEELSLANSHLREEILERQHAQQAAETAKKLADRANRAKSTFIANMSHEFRTPLNGILGYAQILRRDNSLTPRQKAGLDVIEQSGGHLLALVNDVLDLSKIEAHTVELQPAIFNLSDLLTDLVNQFRIRAEKKGLGFTFKAHSDISKCVSGDPRRVRQVLYNLLSNAVKFTETGGVTFCVERLADPQDFQRVHFQIQDTGIGIEAGKLEQIFLPFQQIREHETSPAGTGLGLSICHHLVKLMEGEIHVSSHPNQGSRFWVQIDLPEVSQPEEGRGGFEKCVIGYHGPARHILVIDDKLENRLVLADYLTPLGFMVAESSNGQDGMCKALAYPYDALLIDRAMPGMDGLEMVRQLKQHPGFRHGVIIGLSANADGRVRQEFREVGCDDVLLKPIVFGDLLGLFEKHLSLQWKYQATEEVVDIPNGQQTLDERPDVAQLEELLSLAKKGHIVGIRDSISKMELHSSADCRTTRDIRRLADSFNLKKLCDYLKALLEQGDTGTYAGRQ